MKHVKSIQYVQSSAPETHIHYFEKTVIILQFLKLNSDPLLPASYRPIALFSVPGKLSQKILKKELLWLLKSNNLLSLFQY